MNLWHEPELLRCCSRLICSGLYLWYLWPGLSCLFAQQLGSMPLLLRCFRGLHIEPTLVLRHTVTQPVHTLTSGADRRPAGASLVPSLRSLAWCFDQMGQIVYSNHIGSIQMGLLSCPTNGIKPGCSEMYLLVAKKSLFGPI